MYTDSLYTSYMYIYLATNNYNCLRALGTMGAGTEIMETTGSIIKVGYEVIPQEFFQILFCDS